LTYRRDHSALIDTNGSVVVDDVEKASLFNSYFASVGVVDNGVIPVCDSVLSIDTVIDTVVFNTINVKTALRKLKSNLSSVQMVCHHFSHLFSSG